MKAKAYILVVLVAVITNAYSQNSQRIVDSLQVLLKDHIIDTTRVNLLNSISWEQINLGDYASAMDKAVEAKKLAESLNMELGSAAALKRIGIIYMRNGNYPLSLDYCLQSLRIYERLNNDQMYGVYNNIGNIYRRQENYSTAMDYYFKSLKRHDDKSGVLNNIGLVYMAKADYLLAMEYFRQSLKICQANNDKQGVALALGNIGETYKERHEDESALDCYQKSLSISQDIDDKFGIILSLNHISEIYLNIKKYKKSIEYSLIGLQLSKEIGNLEGIKSAEYTLSEIYRLLNNCSKSLEHYKNYIIASDSIYNEENTDKLVRTEMNSEFDKKQAIEKLEQDKKEAIHSEELRSQRNQRNTFIGGFIVVLIFSIFLFFSFRATKKAKQVISDQKHILQEKSKEITDNIHYASRIQKAMITSDEFIKNNLPESMIIYKPKDIVSGDWYWAYRMDNDVYFATADNTGHGTSGAMLSMISMSLLNEIVIERKITSPELVLNSLRTEIIRSLNQSGAGEERKDGMDISFCKLSLDTLILETACANNPVLIIRDGQAIEIKADRFPVGKYAGEEKPFTLTSTQLIKNDIIYTLTDGYIDQFGGEKGKKLMMKRFKEWTCELSNIDNMSALKENIESRFDQWIGSLEQIDDVTIFAIHI